MKISKVDRHSPPLAYINRQQKKKFEGPEEAEFLLANLMVHNQLILHKIQTPEQQAATPETDQND
ncbi:hypothetical protein N7449_004911 [Penicillium cf. viridicatum]|uniref:Uncharacterized protein n=1 Tax=Penicillium cf. viridicatum TaxID=2972119 RepID=A0A9W9SYL1_9EURO|nr:hypothetical protein N7449_004911 [Penicillium cf. viridicatum]